LIRRDLLASILLLELPEKNLRLNNAAGLPDLELYLFWSSAAESGLLLVADAGLWACHGTDVLVLTLGLAACMCSGVSLFLPSWVFLRVEVDAMFLLLLLRQCLS